MMTTAGSICIQMDNVLLQEIMKKKHIITLMIEITVKSISRKWETQIAKAGNVVCNFKSNMQSAWYPQ